MSLSMRSLDKYFRLSNSTSINLRVRLAVVQFIFEQFYKRFVGISVVRITLFFIGTRQSQVRAYRLRVNDSERFTLEQT